MARDYDVQLLESVAVRRRRLLGALLRGTLHTRRGFDDNVKRGAIGALLAAVLCAGCVGWSFVQHRLTGLSQPAAPTVPVPQRR
jgi:hypothetical protein